jgi:short-subunit dehydrogenase
MEPLGIRRVLVTGAGSGIGRSIAEHAARSGYDVIGTVRDLKRVDQLSQRCRDEKLNLRFMQLDLEVPEQISALAREIKTSGGIDLLVHNAGFGVMGAIEDVGDEDVRRQFEVHVFGPLHLTRLLLPLLRAKRGQILWIGSLAGRISLPFQAHYSATKAAIASLTDALRMELRPFGVRVTCIEPTDYATGFTNARRVIQNPDSVYAHDLSVCRQAATEQEQSGPNPDGLAKIAVRLMRSSSPPARRPVGQFARTIAWLRDLLPYGWVEPLVRRTYRID